MSTAQYILEARNISKSFPGVQALRGVSLPVRRGEIHAIVGENGAGKSTLMKILGGVFPATSGELFLEGELKSIPDTRQAKALGIILINQELSIVPEMTVTENVFVGSEINRCGLLMRSEMRKQTGDLLESLGVDFEPGAVAGRLSIAEQQQVEIARALRHNGRILIMDEPTASLSERETDRLFDVIRRLKAKGITTIFISHRLSEILKIADTVTVLRDGEFIGTIEGDQIEEQTIVNWMVGRKLTDYYQHETASSIRADLFVVEGCSDGKRVTDVSFSVGAGEIVGLAGLVGAGRTELCRLLFGIDRKKTGRVELAGREISIRNPIDAMRHGIGYVPEDRKNQGLFLGMSVAKNICMNVLGSVSRHGLIFSGKVAGIAQAAVEKLNIRTPSINREVMYLSGGNQQKVLLSRWLEIAPKVLILDEPTRGIDVGAKSEIFRLIGRLSQQGVAVIFISSDLPEVIGIAQRILVMHRGTIVKELRDPAGFSLETVVAYATGIAPADYSFARKAG